MNAHHRANVSMGIAERYGSLPWYQPDSAWAYSPNGHASAPGRGRRKARTRSSTGTETGWPPWRTVTWPE